ncbi:MAG: hypothetical protein GY751_25485 [Bacteroidetes bacterium]|nr:hypothetical protein [Bacteroidota bacterium]
MISKIVLTSVLAMFLSGGIFTATDNSDETVTSSTVVSVEQVKDDVTKAIFYNGEVIPLIELPVVEITGKRNTDAFVNATVIDGVIFPNIELDEIVVTPGA